MSAKPRVFTFEYDLEDFNTKEKLDSNRGEPMSIMEGTNSIIKGLEGELVSMQVGESKKVVVKPEEAYGAYDESMIEVHPASNFQGIELSEGMILYGNTEDGQTVQVMVKEFNDESVTVDFNHPLAGRVLAFDMSLTGVREATDEELSTGQIGGDKESCCGSGCGCH